MPLCMCMCVRASKFARASVRVRAGPVLQRCAGIGITDDSCAVVSACGRTSELGRSGKTVRHHCSGETRLFGSQRIATSAPANRVMDCGPMVVPTAAGQRSLAPSIVSETSPPIRCISGPHRALLRYGSLSLMIASRRLPSGAEQAMVWLPVVGRVCCMRPHCCRPGRSPICQRVRKIRLRP